MPKNLDITRILREQKEQLRAGFQDRLVMTASITLRVIARRGLRSGSASAESAAWFIGEADITLRVFNRVPKYCTTEAGKSQEGERNFFAGLLGIVVAAVPGRRCLTKCDAYAIMNHML